MLIYPPAVDVLSVVLCCGKTGRSNFEIITFDLGEWVPDPLDDPISAHFGSVLLVLCDGEMTVDLATEKRDELAAALTRAFAGVEVFDTDLSLAEAMARRFPGAKSRRFLEQLRQEASA